MTLWARSLRPKFGARGPRPPPRCTWKPSTWLPSVVEHQLALETDVGDLGAGAGVGAAVDVDGDRGVEVGEAAAPARRPGRGRGPWCRRSPACRTRCRCRPSCSAATATGRADRPISSSLSQQRFDGVGLDVDQHDLLVRRQARAAHGVLRPSGRRAASRSGAGHPAGRRRERRRRGRRRSARARRRGRGGRPATGATGVRTRARPRYSFSSTSRNLSTPQSATRNFSRARERSRR